MKLEQELYSEHFLDENHFNLLKKCLEYKENLNFPYNSNLAGNIESEYKIFNMDKVLIDQFEEWANDFFSRNYGKNSKLGEVTEKKLTLVDLWINKQKKYEFNPSHTHDGRVSFVCWIKIPYDLEEELSLKRCKNATLTACSLFEFSYTNYLGDICLEHLKIDKSWEGKCIFFDSRLMHQVYPFYTSDEYRISISGNFIPIRNQKDNKQKHFKKITYN